MKRPAHHIDCERCSARGHRALLAYQVDTLRVFLRHHSSPVPRTTVEVMRLARVVGRSPLTATTNRLTVLAALGFVAREKRDGRSYTWSLTDAGYAATRSAP